MRKIFVISLFNNENLFVGCVNKIKFVDLENEEVINTLYAFGLEDNYFAINLTIARGLDYYTGTVYETKLNDYPSLGSICSGGRYDNLAEYYTDQKHPGVGISIGLTRLFYQLLEAGIIKVSNTSSSDVMIIPMCDNYDYIYNICNILKEKGIKVNICYLEKGLKQKMKYANRMNNKYIVIVGEDEVNKKSVVLKNMISGNQITMTLSELVTIKEIFVE